MGRPAHVDGRSAAGFQPVEQPQLRAGVEHDRGLRDAHHGPRRGVRRLAGASTEGLMTQALKVVGLLFFFVALGLSGLCLVNATQPNGGPPPSVAAPEPSETATYRPAPLLPEGSTPSAIPSPSPVETVEQPPVFAGARIAIPSIGVDTEVLEYSLDMMVPSFIPGLEGEQLAVNPPRSDAAYWFSANEALGASLWSKATAKNYIVGHNDPNPGADGVFDHLGEVQVNDIITITTATETFQLQVINVVRENKATLQDNAEVEVNIPGRYLLISCDPDAGYVNGHSEGNVVVIAQVVVPEPEPTTDPEFVARVMDRLTNP